MLPGQLLPADVPSAAPMPIDIKYNNGYRTSRNETKRNETGEKLH